MTFFDASMGTVNSRSVKIQPRPNCTTEQTARHNDTNFLAVFCHLKIIDAASMLVAMYSCSCKTAEDYVCTDYAVTDGRHFACCLPPHAPQNDKYDMAEVH